MIKTDTIENYKNIHAHVSVNADIHVKRQWVLLFVVQLLLMILAFFATYTPVHAEEVISEKTRSMVNDGKVVNAQVDNFQVDNAQIDNTPVVKTLGAFQSLRKSEKNEASVAEHSNSYLMQLVSGLAIVLLSILVLAWIAKRFNRMQSPGGGNLRIVEGISMGARERVVVVEVDGERLLLGVSPGRINMLHSLGGGQTENTAADTSDNQSSNQHKSNWKNSTKKNNEVTFSQKIAAAMMPERS